jgi:hypothetical protein
MSKAPGNDDQKYLALMSRYKELRMELGPKALPYLKAAMKLRKEGDVSDDAFIGAAYM